MQLFKLRDMLREEFAKEMVSISDRLTSGRAADFAEYKQQVGRIQGLRDGIDTLNAVFKKMLNEQDE